MKMPVFDFLRNMAIMCAFGVVLAVLCVVFNLHPLVVIASLVLAGIALGPWRTTR